MRADPIQFALANEARSRRPRAVVQIEFDVASPYITSHDDIPNVPGDVLQGMLQRPSAISQRIIPDEGRSEIGSFTFTLVDKAQAFTIAMRSQLQTQGAGLRRRRVRLYLGAEGMDFSDFQLFQTQIVTRCLYSGGRYEVRCSDITRELQQEVFRPVSTTLRDSVSAFADIIPVYDTSRFHMVAHGTSYSDAPGQTVGYFRLGEEIIRYTGKTSDSFSGCTRGVHNTVAKGYAVDPVTPPDKRPKVEEFIYLEMPGPKLAYAVMTGIIYGTANVLPDHWHLGIDTAFVRLSDFTGIGPDLWDPTDDTAALVFRFVGLKQQSEGKAFLEKEIYLLLGCYSPVYSDGALGLRRRVALISDASPVATLTEREIVSLGELEHRYDLVHNDFRILWAYDPIAEDFIRETGWIDWDSADAHGKSKLLTYQFRGLDGQRATDATLAQRLDSIRDAYAAPPQTTDCTVLGSLNRLEVGDVVRLSVSSDVLRDFAGSAGDYNRSHEIQQKSYDFLSGDVALELFGSTARPGLFPPSDSVNASLPDDFYGAIGTPLTSVLTIVDGIVQAGTYNLTGHASLANAAAIYYYLGDLTFLDGVIINITENVMFQIRGFVTKNGDLVGTGDGQAGVSDPGTGAWDDTFAGNPGFIGNSRGWDGIRVDEVAGITGFHKVRTLPAELTKAKNDAFPSLELRVDGSTLLGLPTDLRGTGGAPGGRIVSQNDSVLAAGGAGGAGGAGFCLICRGFAYGASGSITLNGESTTAPAFITNGNIQMHPGAGGAGSPGSFLLLLDGNQLSFPIMAGKFSALTGTVTQSGNAMVDRSSTLTPNPVIADPIARPGNPHAGYADPAVISGHDYSNAALRIQYIPEPQVPEDDEDATPPAPADLVASHVQGGNSLTWTPPASDAYTVIEVWASIDNNRENATSAGEVKGSAYFHQLPLGGLRYYWIRARIDPEFGRLPLYSEWEPAGPTDGESSNIEAPGEHGEKPVDFTAVGKANGIKFSWALPSVSKMIGFVELFEHTSVSPFASATLAWSGYAVGLFLQKTDTTTRYYWLRLTRSGEVSVVEPVGDGLAAAASSVTAALAATAVPDNLSAGGGFPPPNPKTAVTGSTVVTPTGGTPGYTYAWAWLTGGTGITIDSPASATTTFRGTSFFDGTRMDGVARCTVTDSLSATAYADVTVHLGWTSIL